MKIVSFNTKGHDNFIDFIKAYAIICVLFGHTFPWLDKVAYGAWAGMQVPLFILIQAFHTYKRDNLKINIKKIFQRVLLPFLVIELLTFGLSILVLDYKYNELILNGIKERGVWAWSILSMDIFSGSVITSYIRTCLEKL